MMSFDQMGTRLSSIRRSIRRPTPERASIMSRDGLSIVVCLQVFLSIIAAWGG